MILRVVFVQRLVRAIFVFLPQIQRFQWNILYELRSHSLVYNQYCDYAEYYEVLEGVLKIILFLVYISCCFLWEFFLKFFNFSENCFFRWGKTIQFSTMEHIFESISNLPIQMWYNEKFYEIHIWSGTKILNAGFFYFPIMKGKIYKILRTSK